LTVIAALALLSSCTEPVDPNVCQKLSDNYLLDSDFALEQQDPQSKHWSTPVKPLSNLLLKMAN